MYIRVFCQAGNCHAVVIGFVGFFLTAVYFKPYIISFIIIEDLMCLKAFRITNSKILHDYCARYCNSKI